MNYIVIEMDGQSQTLIVPTGTKKVTISNDIPGKRFTVKENDDEQVVIWLEKGE